MMKIRRDQTEHHRPNQQDLSAETRLIEIYQWWNAKCQTQRCVKPRTHTNEEHNPDIAMYFFKNKLLTAHLLDSGYIFYERATGKNMRIK